MKIQNLDSQYGKLSFCKWHLIAKIFATDDGEMSDSGSEMEEETNYELIGVTVHTGTADGGHYYSFIRDRLSQNELGQDKWSVN